MKVCSKCGEEKPLDEFHRDRSKADGRASSCKACKRLYGRAYYAANADALRERSRTYKEANREKVRARDRQYREEHREKVRAAGRRSYARHAAARREYSRQHREQFGDYYRAYREENRERIREYSRQYAKRYPESNRARKQRRRARLRGAFCGCASGGDIRRVWEADGGRCAYCGDVGEHLDHVEPLAAGGAHCVANLRVACARCNLTKGDRPLPYLLARLRDQGVDPLVDETATGLLTCTLREASRV